MHYHASPDLYERKYDFINAGQKYKELDGAVVLRSHLGSTSIQATIAQGLGLPVFPSVNLNNINGGVHYRNIIRSLVEYQPVLPTRLVVDLPTITRTKHVSKLNRGIMHPNLSKYTKKPETIYSSSKQLKKSIVDIFKLSKDFPVLLTTGHCNFYEIMDLLLLAEKFNVRKLLLNQPHNPITGLDNQNLVQIVKQFPFVFIEQTALTYLLGYQDKASFYQSLSSLPNLLYSSDLGQTSQIGIAEWQQQTLRWFDDINTLSTSRKHAICRMNPLSLMQI